MSRGPDSRDWYAVRMDAEMASGVPDARERYLRAAELAVRPQEEWELERADAWPFGEYFSALLGLQAPWGFSFLSVPHNALHVLSVTYEPATVTLVAPRTTRETVGMAHRRLVKRAPDPRAKPSRVPESLQRTRLDGRRS